jgi:hypothetical protein
MLAFMLCFVGTTALALVAACSPGTAHGCDYTAAALGLDL